MNPPVAKERIFYQVPDTAPIRQGDVVRSDGGSDGSITRYVVVTADCDIAQSKMGQFFTCLEIVSASDYLAHFWAEDELEKLRRKYQTEAISLVFAADRGRDPDVKPLSPADLLDWLQADGPEKIVATLKMAGRSAEACLKALKILELADTSATSALNRLRGVWALLKKSQKDQEGAMRTALKAGQMRSDYLFVPALPAERDVGFIVLLRSMKPILPAHIHASRLAYRIEGASEGYFRLGRLEDFLRYSIAQRWASLYSRIGMTDHFESECETAAEMTLSQI